MNTQLEPTEFIKQKLIRDCQRNWDIFYKRNTTNFFKDRHWVDREFKELLPNGVEKKLLEIGCGVGNFVFPLSKRNPELEIYCCDFSKRAIDFVKNCTDYTEKIHAFVCDITRDPIECQDIDIVSAIFVLSAIPPMFLNSALNNIKKATKKGGVVIVRDYAHLDLAQLRFKAQNKIAENVYVRHDGTFSVFFTIESLTSAFESVGFETIECDYIEKQVINRGKDLTMNRRFIQAKFRA